MPFNPNILLHSRLPYGFPMDDEHRQDLQHMDSTETLYHSDEEDLHHHRLHAFHRLELDSVLGCGSFSYVFHATSLETGDEYAVKALPKHDCTPQQIALLELEAKLHSRLHPHPNIPSIHRVISTPLFTFIVLDLADLDLFEYITRPDKRPFRRPLYHHQQEDSHLVPERECRMIFQGICNAVIHAHKSGVYHRDIKPENILLEYNNEKGTLIPKLGDFGLATEDKWSTEFRCGSTRYLSPQAMGFGIHDHGSLEEDDGDDVHSAYEMEDTRSSIYSVSYDSIDSPCLSDSSIRSNDTRVESGQDGLIGYDTEKNDVWSLGIVLINLLSCRNPWSTPHPSDASYAQFLRNPNFLSEEFGISYELQFLLRDLFTCREELRPTVQEFVELVMECESWRETTKSDHSSNLSTEYVLTESDVTDEADTESQYDLAKNLDHVVVDREVDISKVLVSQLTQSVSCIRLSSSPEVDMDEPELITVDASTNEIKPIKRDDYYCVDSGYESLSPNGVRAPDATTLNLENLKDVKSIKIGKGEKLGKLVTNWSISVNDDHINNNNDTSVKPRFLSNSFRDNSVQSKSFTNSFKDHSVKSKFFTNSFKHDPDETTLYSQFRSCSHPPGMARTDQEDNITLGESEIKMEKHFAGKSDPIHFNENDATQRQRLDDKLPRQRPQLSHICGVSMVADWVDGHERKMSNYSDYFRLGSSADIFPHSFEPCGMPNNRSKSKEPKPKQIKQTRTRQSHTHSQPQSYSQTQRKRVIFGSQVTSSPSLTEFMKAKTQMRFNKKNRKDTPSNARTNEEEINISTDEEDTQVPFGEVGALWCDMMDDDWVI